MDINLALELAQNPKRVTAKTRYGPIVGGRARNGAGVFLEVPYALPPKRFEDAQPLSPETYRYENKEFIRETAYAAQPRNDGQTAAFPAEWLLGHGEPSENPLFVNIFTPPTFNGEEGPKYPVKVYIHGGFLQFGSPHGASAHPQYACEVQNEVYVNIGYRLSVFGFLASARPKIPGNFGFKDQWLALQWIQSNISAFGGNPENITLTGVSAGEPHFLSDLVLLIQKGVHKLDDESIGAHSVHQILHHASHLPQGERAPFVRAQLQSNAMVLAPKTQLELQEQFEVLCRALSIDPLDPEALNTLKDPSKVLWTSIVELLTEDKLGPYGTFRGCLDGDWLPSTVDPMIWQRNGGLAGGLRRVGVKSIVVGDLKDEWYLYAIAHPISSAVDVRKNLLRYYPEDKLDSLLNLYAPLAEDAPQQDCFETFGHVLSDCQVHLPVRLLARDLTAGGFPVLRYGIRWMVQALRSMHGGLITHGTDRAIWRFYEPMFTEEEKTIALKWLRMVNETVQELELAAEAKPLSVALTLREDGMVEWENDTRYEELMGLEAVLNT